MDDFGAPMFLRGVRAGGGRRRPPPPLGNDICQLVHGGS